ncbi:phospholipase D1/2 [Thioclava dalianensis]|uniref:phospholipase D family protein n=1 Tax=Thioclava dalianensis TaxID=1185766 RepID=UPI00068B3ED9|nr:phospholipase D-like domain-containing protein [Thioclava dalianensis]SFN32937.1 phospholipase D1/2 [Thioclava dalianensis]
MDRLRRVGIQPASRTKLLLTAAEAYPVLEAAFLDAREEIHVSFRVFDLETKLFSARGRQVGKTWFDLIVHVVARGLRVQVDLCDFDPCARPDLHRGTWRSMRMLAAARELAGPRAQLTTRALLHPARSGIAVRLAFWPLVMSKLSKHAQWLNEQPEKSRATLLRDMPGLAPHLVPSGQGRYARRLSGLPHLFPATHHQKIALFDAKKLYIGGLDLDNRRYDTPDHERRGERTWHDVQLLMTGPVAREAKAHLETYHEACAGQADAPPPRRLLRTIARRRKRAPFAIGPKSYRFEIATAHGMLVARAQKLIYLETQFFRSTALAKQLAKAARDNSALQMILLLPAAPEELAFEHSTGPDVRYGEFLQARAVKIVREAFGDRLFVGCPGQPRSARRPAQQEDGRDRLSGAPLVYTHAKVSIFDDESAIVSSANLNGRSLAWDTEAGVYLRRSDGVEQIRYRIMRHWLPENAGPECFALETAVARWTEIARKNADVPPDDRRGFLMPYSRSKAQEIGRNLPFIPEEMV